MATLLKIRGLDRGQSVGDNPVLSSGGRGFRVKWGLGQRSDSGTAATLTIGTSNAAVAYTAKFGGTLGNNIQVAHVVNATQATRTIVVTFQAATGQPIITVNPVTVASAVQASETAASIAASVNADPVASQYVTAAAGGTGASVIVAGAATNLATGTNGTGILENVYLPVTDRATVVVDMDDPATARMLRRATGRYVSLGQP